MLIGQRILVVGAGIAGLAAARALSLRGAQVRVVEASGANRVGGEGGGLQISPNGVRVLDALGLGQAARQNALQSSAVHLLDGFTGKRITRLDLAKHRAEGLEYLLFRRGDLIALLAEGARAAGVEISPETEADWQEVTPEGAKLRLNGEAQTAPLVLAADGIGSGARALLNGVETPQFTGQVAWRAVIKDSAPLETRAFLGPGMHLVSYPLTGGYRNIAAFHEQKDWQAEGWHHEASPAAFQHEFSSFCPEVRQMLAKVDQVRLWGLFLRPMAQHWHDGAGRLALLGDAAHPTLPYMAQGANMALEDAWLLAAALASHPAPEAMARWQALRAPRVARALAAARANARNYHLRGLARYGAHKVLKIGGLLAPSVALRQFDWLYREDVTRIEV